MYKDIKFLTAYAQSINGNLTLAWILWQFCILNELSQKTAATLSSLKEKLQRDSSLLVFDISKCIPEGTKNFCTSGTLKSRSAVSFDTKHHLCESRLASKTHSQSGLFGGVWRNPSISQGSLLYHRRRWSQLLAISLEAFSAFLKGVICLPSKPLYTTILCKVSGFEGARRLLFLLPLELAMCKPKCSQKICLAVLGDKRTKQQVRELVPIILTVFDFIFSETGEQWNQRVKTCPQKLHQ